MTAAAWLLVIFGAGLGSYALRAAPFLWSRLHKLGRDNFRMLSYVSFAIAAGIVSRAVTYRGDTFAAPSEIGVKILAVLIALGLLRLTRNLPLALFTGAGFGVLLKWWGG